jgi:hypothetical protein
MLWRSTGEKRSISRREITLDEIPRTLWLDWFLEHAQITAAH